MSATAALTQLSALRQRREERASAELAAQRRTLQQAQADQLCAEQDQAAFGPQRKAREEALFRDLQNSSRPVQRRELDEFAIEVERLNDQQKALAARVSAAVEAVAKAEQQVVEARSAWQAAARNCLKLEQFVTIEQAAEAVLVERAEDNETEEFQRCQQR